MSFSKAKIHRFNDDIPCAPPPGAYNPENVDKSVGPIIHKSERFSESGKLMIHASSTDSINSLSSERGTTSTGVSFATFKTPKIPSTYRAISRTDVGRKGNFSCTKSASTDFINKKSCRKEHEMNPLKYSLKMLQDELAIEKSKNQQLLEQLSDLNENTSEGDHSSSPHALQEELEIEKTKNQQLLLELNRMTENTSEAERFSEYLINTVREKNNFIDLLTEKCSALQQISVQNFESYQSYVKNMHEILQEQYKLSSKTDSDLAELVDRYEKLITEYEQDIESFFVFLVDLQQKQSSKDFSRPVVDDSLRQCNILLETLKETERGRIRYETILQEMNKVIHVLSGRVHESDVEVEKAYQVISTLNQEKAKLCAIIQNKEGEITTMRDIVDTVSKKFFNGVRDTEKNLLILVDEFRERASAERKAYETNLSRKDTIISELSRVKNEKELQLQEALDQVEILKCKEENLEKTFDRVQCDLRDKCIRFQKAYEECCEKLKDLEREYESSASEAKVNSRNDSVNTLTELAKKIVSSLVQKDFVNGNIVDQFDNVENSEQSMIALQELLIDRFANDSSHKLAFLPHLIDTVSVTFSKLASDNDALKNDLTRLRNDFIEKCDECGQLTRLLQLSEKKIENFERKTTELESRLDKVEEKREQNEYIVELESENLNLKQQLAFESNVKESELIIECRAITDEEETYQRMKVDDALKEERAKNEELENRVAALEALVEKLEAEKKPMPKNDSKNIPKNSKRLSVRNQASKSKIACLQPKRINQDSNRKSGLLAEGKENQIVTKNNETFEIKKAVAVEVPMNATYVVTSPKVSRI